jgi:hypothetical protein
VVTFLNQGRQLAIRTNQNVCVHSTSTAMQYRLSNCGGGDLGGARHRFDGQHQRPAGYITHDHNRPGVQLCRRRHAACDLYGHELPRWA